MRLIDADQFLIDNAEFACRNTTHPIYEDTVKDLIDASPTVDQWHYPSKGDLPTSGEEVLCWLWGTTPDVGCWNEKDKLWHFDEFEEETVDRWQYIMPPKEEK